MNENEIYQKAIEYSSKKGWIVHPVKYKGKRPVIKKFQLRTKPRSENELKKHFLDGKKQNIGLLCGKNSGVTLIDFDNYLFRDDLFDGVEINTLRDERIEGRGHYYFEYTPDLKSANYSKTLGIEIFNDGGHQVVIPPSKHPDGQYYKFIDEDTQLQEIPDKVKSNWKSMTNTFDELQTAINKCRPWVAKVFKEKPDVHEEKTMLALAAELMFNGIEEKHMQMFCKIMLGSHYTSYKTSYKWQYVKPTPWSEPILKENLPTGMQKYLTPELLRSQTNNLSSKNGHGVDKDTKEELVVYRAMDTLNKCYVKVVNEVIYEFRYKPNYKKAHKLKKRLLYLGNGEYVDKNYGGVKGNEKVVEYYNSQFAWIIEKCYRPETKWEKYSNKCSSRILTIPYPNFLGGSRKVRQCKTINEDGYWVYYQHPYEPPTKMKDKKKLAKELATTNQNFSKRYIAEASGLSLRTIYYLFEKYSPSYEMRQWLKKNAKAKMSKSCEILNDSSAINKAKVV